MIDNSLIYQNPVIPSNFYYAKVISVEEEPANYIFPKLLITLILHADYGLHPTTVFSAIIHPTQKSYWHYKNFFNTFMLGDFTNELHKAIGEWGSIRIDRTQYGETEYSSVKFVYQPLPIRAKAWKLGELEKEAQGIS